MKNVLIERINNSEMENQIRHICTVQLQEYFQHKVFKKIIQTSHWTRLESFIKEDVEKTLEVLQTHDVKATFFTSGWIAENHPELLRTISDKGHELACIGYYDYSYNDVPEEDFVTDVRRAKYLIEDATGQAVLGYRAVQKPVVKNKQEFLSLLAAEEFRYDSSFHNPFFTFNRIPRAQKEIYRDDESGIWELPLPSMDIGPFHLPAGGGNGLRQYPTAVKRRFQFHNSRQIPFVLYFHPWELSDMQPHISAFDSITRLRLYRNLGSVTESLEEILSQGAFVSAAEFLELNQEVAKRENRKEILVPVSTQSSGLYKDHEQILSIVVPCYNESDTLHYLKNNLVSFEQGLDDNISVRYIFVDDASRDTTFEQLNELFGEDERVTILRHEENQGVAGAIRTGLRAAKTELVASIDADCSYDPLELVSMLKYLDPDVAIVTASPYHRNGRVLGVPEWRLFLSKGLSGIYRRIMKHKLATYTACFRVYRKRLIMDSLNTWGDFRGIVELLVRLDFMGQKIREYPTTLHSRIFGFSKMKTLNTIFKHISFLSSLGSIRKDVRRLCPECR